MNCPMNCVGSALLRIQFNNWHYHISELPERMQNTGVVLDDQPSGSLIQESTANTSVSEFVEELLESFGLVAAFMTQVPKKPRGTKYAASFVFIPKANWRKDPVSSMKANDLEAALSALNRVSAYTMWSAQVWKNPFLDNNKVVPEKCGLSINLSARRQLLDNEGVPVMVWQRDADGRKLGPKIALEPDARLGIVGGEMRLLPKN